MVAEDEDEKRIAVVCVNCAARLIKFFVAFFHTIGYVEHSTISVLFQVELHSDRLGSKNGIPYAATQNAK